jgi:hypothetical protein
VEASRVCGEPTRRGRAGSVCAVGRAGTSGATTPPPTPDEATEPCAGETRTVRVAPDTGRCAGRRAVHRGGRASATSATARVTRPTAGPATRSRSSTAPGETVPPDVVASDRVSRAETGSGAPEGKSGAPLESIEPAEPTGSATWPGASSACATELPTAVSSHAPTTNIEQTTTRRTNTPRSDRVPAE